MSSKAAAEQHETVNIGALRPEDFSSWDALVSRSPHGTVFHYSWWLQATKCDFEILVCRDGDGEITAGIPLPRKKRAGLTLFHSPTLTPYLGPIFDLSKATGMPERLSIMRHSGEVLARAIKGYDNLCYIASAAAPDLQGFLWAGYRVELEYTFRFDAGISLDQISQGMAKSQRGALAKADRGQTILEAQDSIDLLIQLSKQTFSRQGLLLTYPESLLRRLWSAAQSRGQAIIYLSRTHHGLLAAGVLIVNDARCSYLLIVGINPEVRSSGGSNLVMWHAIKDSILAGRAFDFEGSSIPGVEQYYRHWGGTPKPVWRLERTGSLRGALARTLVQMRSNRNGK